jgi:Zn ribbon nucleic-acid-binding protein
MWCPKCGDSDRYFWVDAKIPGRVCVDFGADPDDRIISDDDTNRANAEIAPGALYRCANCDDEFPLANLSTTEPELEDEEVEV